MFIDTYIINSFFSYINRKSKKWHEIAVFPHTFYPAVKMAAVLRFLAGKQPNFARRGQAVAVPANKILPKL